MRRRHRFPESTAGRYLPGVGITLTRANLEYMQAVNALPQELTAAALAREFTKPGPHSEPHPRHVERAGWLLYGQQQRRESRKERKK